VFATNKLGSTYHSFSHYDNDRKALETADNVQRDVAWSHSDWLGHARAGPMRLNPRPIKLAARICQILEFAQGKTIEARAVGST
jgi:hypothetical protein